MSLIFSSYVFAESVDPETLKDVADSAVEGNTTGNSGDPCDYENVRVAAAIADNTVTPRVKGNSSPKQRATDQGGKNGQLRISDSPNYQVAINSDPFGSPCRFR